MILPLLALLDCARYLTHKPVLKLEFGIADFQYTFLFFIQVGSKRVICPINGELIGYAKEVMIFPPGSIATLENRPVLDADYRAVGVCFPHHMIESVFSDEGYHYQDENPLSKIRRLIETDLGHPWRSNEVAEHFSISRPLA